MPDSPQSSAAPASTTPKPRWRRRAQRGVFAFAALLVVLLALGYYYTRPQQLTPIIEGLLSKSIGGVAQLHHVRLDFTGQLTLEGLTLDLPGGPDAHAPGYARLFDCERITVGMDLRRIWRGVVDVNAIDIRRPRIHLVENPQLGRLNLEDLPLPRGNDSDTKVELRLPPLISLIDAEARFATLTPAGADRTDAVLGLAGELREQAAHPRRYDLALRTFGNAEVADTQLKGWVDTGTPGINLDLAGLAFNASYRPFVPPAFRELWDHLDPVGRVPAAAVNLETDSSGRIRLNRALIELTDVALTPPYAELGLFDDDIAPNAAGPRYAPRMTRVTGRLIADHQSVRIESLTGTIEGIDYHLSGSWGLNAATAGALTLQTDPFTVERNPLFVSGLPAAAARMFAGLKPSGRFRATTHVRRSTPGGPVAVSGRVQILDARAVYDKFPLPIEGLRGEVSFDPDAVRLDGLTGRGPGGGIITLNGEITPPRRHAEVALRVTARDVPYDDHLRQALGRHAAVADLFLSQEKLDAITQMPGVAATLAAPSAVAHGGGFTLGGKINTDVSIERPSGPDKRPAVSVTVHAAGLGAVFQHFPYPVTATGGRVIVAGPNVVLEDLTLSGPTGASATVTGRINRPDKRGPVFPDIRVSDIRAPADALLLAALPASAQEHLRPLNIQGEARGQVTVVRPPAGGDTQFVVHGKLTGAQAQPGSGTLTAGPLDADFVVTRDHTEITALRSGLDVGGTLDLTARFDWARDRRGFTLDGAARGVAFTPALADLIPEQNGVKRQVLDFMDRWQPGGDGNLRLEVQRHASGAAPGTDTPGAPDANDLDYTFEVEPRTLSLVHPHAPLRFERMSGRATLRNGHLGLNELTGEFPAGRATVNGQVGLDPGAATVLDLTATTTLPCPVAEAVLPPVVQDLLADLEVSGGVTLRDARLRLHPNAGRDENTVEFDGRLGLHDTRLSLGLPVTAVRGDMLTRVRVGAGRTHPELAFDLNLETLRMSDREISPLNVRLDNARWPDTLSFGPMLGSVYGGVLVGEGKIPLTDEQPCQLEFSVTDVNVAQFINATAPPEGPATVPRTPSPRAFSDPAGVSSSGLLSAGFTLELPLDRPEERRGRGVLRIHDADLFNRPFSNALLRASNLSLPLGAPLDRAWARYLLDGDTVRFDDLSISGPGLSINGTGTMTLPDQRLRLLMVSRNTEGPDIGPITDLFEMFRDELIAIKVRGTLQQPTTEVTALSGIRKSINTLFRDP